MNNLEKDIKGFEFLLPYIENDTIKYIDDSGPFFQKILKAFPIQSIRINWESIPHKQIYLGTEYIENVEKISCVVTEIFENEGINTDSNVIVCFDGITNGAFIIPTYIFLLHSSDILTTPQHTYVIPEDVHWCLNYTFENYLYFGYAPSQR